MSVALAPGLREEVRAAAARAGKSLDDWFTEAVEAQLAAEENAMTLEDAARANRHRALGEYLDQGEAQHGAFTDEELAGTAEKLGWPWPPGSERGCAVGGEARKVVSSGNEIMWVGVTVLWPAIRSVGCWRGPERPAARDLDEHLGMGWHEQRR
jgi:hypothetical protein